MSEKNIFLGLSSLPKIINKLSLSLEIFNLWSRKRWGGGADLKQNLKLKKTLLNSEIKWRKL